MDPDIPGFLGFEFTDGDITHTVYRRGSGRAVLLMHELPGMTQECIEYANELAQMFAVYMPLLFGKPYDNSNVKFVPHICISKELAALSNGGGGTLVGWLRALGRKALQDCGGPGIGAIGMCLTGNFAIALMADETVLAPVASQPALPITAAVPVLRAVMPGARAALGLTPEQLAAAKQRAAQGVPLMCLRFSNDRISPAERFDALRTTFGTAFRPFLRHSTKGIDASRDNPYGLKQNAHSVLTGEYNSDPPDNPMRQARDAVREFLKERLG